MDKLQQILQHIADLQKKAQKLQQQKKSEILEEVIAKIKSYWLTAK